MTLFAGFHTALRWSSQRDLLYCRVLMRFSLGIYDVIYVVNCASKKFHLALLWMK